MFEILMRYLFGIIFELEIIREYFLEDDRSVRCLPCIFKSCWCTVTYCCESYSNCKTFWNIVYLIKYIAKILIISFLYILLYYLLYFKLFD